jgi:hypothetical protein
MSVPARGGRDGLYGHTSRIVFLFVFCVNDLGKERMKNG